MRGFDVLDPSLPLRQTYFLEASAGTGKTFAIEHIVARLLASGIPLCEILAVTFTRAAASELKARIRQTLTKLLEKKNIPPYAENWGDQERVKLRIALADYDSAHFFTIHGFCFHILQEHAFDADFALDQQEESSLSQINHIVKDYLRTGISEKDVCQRQLEKVLNFHQNDLDLLVKAIVSLASQRLPIEGATSYVFLKEKIGKEIGMLSKQYVIEEPLLFEDLMRLAPNYSKFCDRRKNVKPAMIEGLRQFAKLFHQKEIEFIDLPILLMVEKNRLKTAKEPSLHYPGLLEQMQQTLIPLLASASDELALLALIAEGARQHLERVVEKDDLCFFEDLIKRMAKQIENKEVAESVRKNYKAVLIDEFQDTDPEQWKIFSSLFLHPNFNGPLYFVGDPKQAIYRFRQADIYTYLEAKQAIGEEAQFQLARNFRSDPSLVDGLNTLFQAAEGFLYLPKKNENVDCPPIEAGLTPSKSWDDGNKSIHFCMASSEKALFQFIIEEIGKLNRDFAVPLNACAVLVKDRYQANRFIKCCPYPTAAKRSESLLDSKALAAAKDLLRAASQPSNKNFVAAVLLGPLFALPLDGLQEALELNRERFYAYRSLVEEEGILALMDAYVEQEGPRLIMRENGERLLADFQHVCELLAQENDEPLASLERLLLEDPGLEKLRARADGGEDAIQVMTIHVSKGLEFPVVFPIGLAYPTSEKRSMIRSHHKRALILSDQEALLHRQESDAEKMRQLYVAFTRAKKRLYPLVNEKASAPINHFMQRLNPELSSLAGEAISIGYQPETDNKAPSLAKAPISLLEPDYPLVAFPAIKMHSFSSLTRDLPYERPALREKHPLPSGPETGILIHKIFEKLPFEDAFRMQSPYELAPSIAPFLKNTHLENWLESIAEMIFAALHTPLPAEKPFCLADVDPTLMMKEMEFLCGGEPDYFKGCVDLFFEHEGRCYFLDWKTNDLGPSKDDYIKSALEKEISNHQYDLQARIYRSALERYIRLFANKKIEKAFIIFLRGLSTEGTGIYSFDS